MRSVEAAGFWTKFSKTFTWYKQEALIRARQLWWPLMQPGLDRPVFVVGCSRAGTTLVYKLLSGSTKLGSLQRETHDVWSQLHPLSERDWSSHKLGAEDARESDRLFMARYFRVYTGRSRIVDKNNQNGLCIPYLYALYPDARFLYVKRHPGDNINSLIQGWARPAEFGAWSEELPEKVSISEGRYTRWCFFLPEGWRSYCDAPIETVCAFQYRSMNESILRARDNIPRQQWIEVCYEDLLRDPDEALARIFNFCDVSYTMRLRAVCERIMATPFNAFSEIGLEKWKSDEHSERIHRVLESVKGVAGEMGYFDY